MEDSMDGRARPLTALALGVLGAIVPAMVHAQQAHPAAIPVELTVPFVPQGVVAEGERHFIYELHIGNFGSAALTLASVEVLNDMTDEVVASYAGDGLKSVLARPGTPGLSDRRVMGGGLRAVVFVDVHAASTTAAPVRLRHRVTFVPVTPPDGPRQSVVEGARLTPRRDLPGTLGPPLSGGEWVASHGLSNASSHRRTLLAIDGRAQIAQRYAVDWTRVGADGRVFRGDPSRNANWTPYGAAVLAVGDGRIVELQDGIPENDPTADRKAVPITLTTVGGNHLILDLGNGRYAFYAHLQPGSFAVTRGAQVTRGQLLAKLGNSGQSDAPHLHLHIVDAPSPLAAEGLPLVFESFELEGHVPSLKVFTDGTGWRATGVPSMRRGEMPVENAVVRFPDVR
jgi:hypothetical protein